jgi:hypothetical protein
LLCHAYNRNMILSNLLVRLPVQGIAEICRNNTSLVSDLNLCTRAADTPSPVEV